MTKMGWGTSFICVAMLMLVTIQSSAAELITAKQYGDIWPFPAEKNGVLYCKELGSGRKAVWLNADSTYALNGQAMTWMIGANLTDSDGGLVKKGRDFSENQKGLNQLIQDGLALCK